MDVHNIFVVRTTVDTPGPATPRRTAESRVLYDIFIDIGDMARTEETYEGHSIVAENGDDHA